MKLNLLGTIAFSILVLSTTASARTARVSVESQTYSSPTDLISGVVESNLIDEIRKECSAESNVLSISNVKMSIIPGLGQGKAKIEKQDGRSTLMLIYPKVRASALVECAN